MTPIRVRDYYFYQSALAVSSNNLENKTDVKINITNGPTMNKPEDKKAVKSLPTHIADMPEVQRKSMEKARNEGKFEAKAHLDRSPIGKAAAKGFPIPKR